MRIAENLLSHLPNVDKVAFAYGSLAPDSGVPNADGTAFDPPKEITHFLQKGEGENAIHDYRFYQDYLALMTPAFDGVSYSFRLGYFFHLICDNLWARKIATTTKMAFANEIEADPKKAWNRIKRDWYGLDQMFVHHHPQSIFWQVIATIPNPPSYLRFIPDAVFHHQMNDIRDFYSYPRPEWITPRAYTYLNERTMTRIVDDSTAIVLRIWENHHRFHEAAIMGTTLALVPNDYLRPYEMPLGDSGE